MVVQQEHMDERMPTEDQDAPRVCRSTTASVKPGFGARGVLLLQSVPLGIGAPLSRAALVSPPIFADAATIFNRSQFGVMLREARATLPFMQNDSAGEWPRESQPLTNWRNLNVWIAPRERDHYGSSELVDQELFQVFSRHSHWPESRRPATSNHVNKSGGVNLSQAMR